MKWLIILGLLILVWAIIAVRYRRQIQTAIYVWKMFRKMRQPEKTAEKQIEKKENSGDVSLVKCAKCGTWIPQKNAFNLRSKIFYCSANCMESAVKVS
jgi:Sec-independent protein translocase protein TatA